MYFFLLLLAFIFILSIMSFIPYAGLIILILYVVFAYSRIKKVRSSYQNQSFNQTNERQTKDSRIKDDVIDGDYQESEIN